MVTIKAILKSFHLIEYSGAFWGAFFAFLFLKLSDYLKNISNRKSLNRKSLVKMEYFTNMQLSDLNDNVFIMDIIINACKESNISESNLNIIANLPKRIDFDSQILLDLTNLNYINESMDYFDRLKKLNEDVETIVNSYKKFEDALLSEKITDENYKLFLQIFQTRNIEFKKHIMQIQEQAKRIAAISRILRRRGENIFFKLFFFLVNGIKRNYNEKEIFSELKKVEMEIERNYQESRKRLQDINNKQI